MMSKRLLALSNFIIDCFSGRYRFGKKNFSFENFALGWRSQSFGLVETSRDSLLLQRIANFQFDDSVQDSNRNSLNSKLHSPCIRIPHYSVPCSIPRGVKAWETRIFDLKKPVQKRLLQTFRCQDLEL